MEQTVRDYLMDTMARYPRAELGDLYKALFQGAFGCAHAVQDAEQAEDWILRESAMLEETALPLVEPLPGEYSRVSLQWLREGLSPRSLARLFQLSARSAPRGTDALEESLKLLPELAGQGLLPFSAEEAQAAVSEWRSAGFPACHHSAAFRDAYHPAYRLILKEYVPLLPLFSAIDRKLAQAEQPVILALDGGSAAGKTTLALFLQRHYGCAVLHMDDYFLQPSQRTPERLAQPGGNVDYERFLREVLLPLRQGKRAFVRAYHCQTDTLLPPQPVTPGALYLVEGAYSMHPALRTHYDLSVFLEVTPEVQRERILRRNSPELQQQFFSRWIPLEQQYFAACDVPAQCTLRLGLR